MWAASTLSCRLWPLTTTTTATATATAGGSQGPFTVFARYSRPRRNIKYDYEDDELDNQRELDMLKQQEIGESEEASADPKDKISGSVVLLALQKASAEKTSKKMKKKMKNNKIKNMNMKVPRQGDASADFSDVKPLCIKSDWKDRLDELETQLHQLIHNA